MEVHTNVNLIQLDELAYDEMNCCNLQMRQI
jgi:hypothetical protein